MQSPQLFQQFPPPEANIIFAGDSAYPPFEWSGDNGPEGFNVDLAGAISVQGGTSVRYLLGEWRDTIEALESGDVDVAAMFVSPAREKLFHFTTPFYVVNHAVYASESHPQVNGAYNFSGQRVAVEERSVAHEKLLAEDLAVDIVLTASTQAALEAVLSGQADSVITTEPTAEYLIDNLELPLNRVSPPFWPSSYAFAVKHGRDDLHLWLQNALNAAIASNGYQDIYENWKSEIRPDGNSLIHIPFYVGYTAITAILFMVTFFLWSWTLRRKVINKTSDLQAALVRVSQSESHARYMADYETETDLARPHYFNQLVNEKLKQCPVNSELMIFRLIRLNEVSGTLGQSYSKELIETITARLKARITGPCCYFGRGTFALFSSRTEVRRFLEALSNEQTKQMPYIRYVAGSARFSKHGRSSEELLANADSALLTAFFNNKEWVVYDHSMDPSPKDQEIITALRTCSLEGMYAVYQPQIDIVTGQLTGAEALVRWQHPTLGALSPCDFIPLVETLGYISQVTEKMIDAAVDLAVRLREEGRPMVISVNVSVHDLADPAFFAKVKNAIQRCQGAFCDLKLELTETSFSSEIGTISETLTRLKCLGVGISIDDFGTGYSSLTYLSMFPVQELKIDQTFVFNLEANTKNCDIIRSTLMLAEHLKIKTVAEGVEDKETLSKLRELKCGCAQGYFISKPLPEAEFLKFIKEYSAPGQA
ncbi:putative bifunctional diguanylate cyclase/phosphodiesterase [Pseudidiomarina sp.]|uniref:putative bifunctional diguanylate cyclase/phosphodiesterase n=1 Tax=Pseudidiomarina sp. TaxID=2081707 RepID=UPI00299F1146|nr:EAL domain-containing protein [Pseudidiomarina sp.]MDX1705355.1 EAL domain-containing protein [Pseudidiomarina sp.]